MYTQTYGEALLQYYGNYDIIVLYVFSYTHDKYGSFDFATLLPELRPAGQAQNRKSIFHTIYG